MDTNKERRAYFRINDFVGLSFSPLESSATHKINSNADEVSIPVKNLLSQIDSELNTLINLVWQKDELAAQALGLLNRKISILSSNILDDEQPSVNSHETVLVNISGCGIAFTCDEPLSKNTILNLSIILKPSNINLRIQGKVVSCSQGKTKSTSPYWLRVRFDDRYVSEQEQLIQHIVQKHSSVIGNKM